MAYTYASTSDSSATIGSTESLLATVAKPGPVYTSHPQVNAAGRLAPLTTFGYISTLVRKVIASDNIAASPSTTESKATDLDTLRTLTWGPRPSEKIASAHGPDTTSKPHETPIEKRQFFGDCPGFDGGCANAASSSRPTLRLPSVMSLTGFLTGVSVLFVLLGWISIFVV